MTANRHGLLATAAFVFCACGEAQEQAAKPAPLTMRITVLDPDDKPMPDVNIHVGLWTKEPFKANRDFKTAADGKTTIELPQKIDILRLWATKESYVGLFAQWWPEQQADGHLIPEEYKF